MPTFMVVTLRTTMCRCTGQLHIIVIVQCNQHAKKVMTDSPALVDSALRVMNSVLLLPNRQVVEFLLLLLFFFFRGGGVKLQRNCK